MRLVLDRSVSLTGADGAMLCLVDGDQLITRAAVGHCPQGSDEPPAREQRGQARDRDRASRS